MTGKPQPLSSEEALYWMAYADIEPFGPVQEDFRAGTIASLLYNSHRTKDAPALRAEDFFPSCGPPPEVKAEQERNQERAKMLWWIAQQNAQAAAAKRLQRNGSMSGPEVGVNS